MQIADTWWLWISSIEAKCTNEIWRSDSNGETRTFSHATNRAEWQ